MTYLQFHLVFIVPPLLALVLWTWRVHRSGGTLPGLLGGTSRFALGVIGVHMLIALLYTTPWDNYLVYRSVWGYPEGRVMATLGYVPVEEYLFFLLQTLLTGLWFLTVGRMNFSLYEVARPLRWRSGGVVVALGLAAAGLLALTTERGTYLGLILVWAGPVLALLGGFGGDWLLERWRAVALGIAVPTLYLWLADRTAIGLNIWWIAEDLTLGIRPFGLPVEEALFFCLTNVFVVFGMTLSLHPGALARGQALLGRARAQGWWRGALALWALSMIPTPLIPDAFPLLAYLSTGLLSLGVLGYALERYGLKALALFALAFGFGLGVEWLGETTGFPFGRYRYTAPGPALFGVPLLVPLGWWGFSLIALAVAPRRGKPLLAPLALVAWDLGLDPLMVNEGFWTFASGGVYYGVPLSNFAGWLLAGLVLMRLLLWLEPKLWEERGLELRLSYLVQAFLMSLGLIFFGMPVAGLVTLAAMLGFCLPLVKTLVTPATLPASE